MSSSMCFGSGALAEYVGDRVEPERDGDLDPPVGREVVGAPVLVDLPVHRGRARGRAPASGTCRRCACRCAGRCVITAGRRDERRRRRPASRSGSAAAPRSTSSPRERRSPAQAPLRTVLRQRVGDRLQLLRARAPCRRGPAAAASRARPRASRATSSSRSTPNARHMRRSVPNWLISSGCSEPFGLLEQQRRPAGLDRAVDDLRDLEVRDRPRRRRGRARLRARGARSRHAGRLAAPSAVSLRRGPSPNVSAGKLTTACAA